MSRAPEQAKRLEPASKRERMTGASKTEVSATGFAPHIEELHELFRSRNVPFGAAEDLAPFVERIEKDASFRDEMASMVRAII